MRENDCCSEQLIITPTSNFECRFFIPKKNMDGRLRIKAEGGREKLLWCISHTDSVSVSIF